MHFKARDAQGLGRLVFESADVSAGGTFLRSELLFEPDEVLSLELQVGDGQVVRATARVAWVRRFPQRGEPAGMGLEFTAMGEADRAVLARLLAS